MNLKQIRLPNFSERCGKKNYDRIELIVPKGWKQVLKNHAKSRGESLNGFINRSIDEAMYRDDVRELSDDVVSAYISARATPEQIHRASKPGMSCNEIDVVAEILSKQVKDLMNHP